MRLNRSAWGCIGLVLISTNLWAASQQVVEFNVVGGSGGKLAVIVNYTASPRMIDTIQFKGGVLGDSVNQSYGSSDLVRMENSGAPSEVVSYLGMDAMNFLPGTDFSLQDGGEITVGYRVSYSRSAKANIQMVWDSGRGKWFLDYHPSGSSEVYRLVSVKIIMNSEIFIGVTGIQSLVGTDDQGRTVILQPGS